MAYVGVHDVCGVSGGRNHERWEEDLLETVTVKEEAAPAPATTCFPFTRLLLRQFLKFVDRALPYVGFVPWERKELCSWILMALACNNLENGGSLDGPYIKCQLAFVHVAHLIILCIVGIW